MNLLAKLRLSLGDGGVIRDPHEELHQVVQFVEIPDHYLKCFKESQLFDIVAEDQVSFMVDARWSVTLKSALVAATGIIFSVQSLRGGGATALSCDAPRTLLRAIVMRSTQTRNHIHHIALWSFL